MWRLEVYGFIFFSLTIKPFPKEVYSYTVSRLTVQGGESRDIFRLFFGQNGQENYSLLS